MNLMPEIPAKLVRIPPANFTWVNTYRNICPHQAYRRYILKDIPYQETEAMRVGNAVHTAMEHRIGKGKVLPDEYRQYEPFAACFDKLPVKVEWRLGVTVEGKSCDWYDPKIFIRSKLDVALVQGEVGYLADHKTGKVKENPFELEVQAVALHAKHPELKSIKGQYLWLKELRTGEIHDVSHTNKTWDVVCRTVQQAAFDLKQGEFEKRQGPLCRFCDVTDCEFNAKQPG